MIKVTLCMTIWKRRKHLEEFIARWLAQPEIDEIIIWNNGEFYQNSDPRIKVINSSYNYNAWVRDMITHLAKNDIVLICDDDIFVEDGFVNQMLVYYQDNRMLGIWGNIFNKSYEDRKTVKGNDLDEPIEVDAIVGLVYIIDRRYLYPIDHRDFKWTAYDIELSGILKRDYPQVKKIVVPNKLWKQTEEETDEFALCKHPDAKKEKQELYERYWK